MGYSAKQRKVKATVEGGEKIVKELKAMESAAADVLMKSAKAGGQIALADAKRNCPVDTGALRDSLELAEVSATEKKATVKVDYDKKLKYGTHVDLGARGRAANPFLRNAVDDNIDQINEEIVKEISKAIGAAL